MNTSATCPRCNVPLDRIADSGDLTDAKQDASLRCESCHGVFVPASQLRQDSFSSDDGSAVSDQPSEMPAAICPCCGQPMRELQLGDVLIDRCESCGGVWLDPGEGLQGDQSAGTATALSRYLVYSVTLPERAVRSAIGLASGAAKETAEFLVPQAFQNSKTYEIVVRNSLRFLTEDIGGAAVEAEASTEVENYMARKAVGNFVDLAGLATLHLSPLWILAIVSDIAYGSKSYVLELAEELKQRGLIDDTSTIHHVDDVLEAIQQASGRAASTFDTPPLSVDQLRQSLVETRDAVKSAQYMSVLPEAELSRYWEEMREIAVKEEVSLLGVSAAMTMHSLGKMKTVSQGALTGLRVAGGLLNRHVIGHYVDSLQTLREEGFYRTVQDSYAPYVEAVWSNFAVDKETWTEELVSGRILGKAFKSVAGWFGRHRADGNVDHDES